jgi:hypothetical protein
VWVDVEDVWPAAASLAGLQFATDEDFERCRTWLSERPERFYEAYPESLMIAVRKADATLIADAGLPYTTVVLRDMDDLPPEEARRIERALIDEWTPRFIERLQRAR